MKIKQSTKLDDIYDVNMRSAGSCSGICICELGSLDDLIGIKKAEVVREKLLKNKVKTKQLTNHKILKEWTKLDEFVSKTMEIRYIPQEIFIISREILIFDDTVAIYRKNREVSYFEVRDITYAHALRQFFESLWEKANPMKINNYGAGTLKNRGVNNE